MHPVQVSCFMSRDIKGGSLGEEKGLEHRSLHRIPGLLAKPGREEEGASVLTLRLELRTVTSEGNKLVPSLCPPRILFLLALVLESAQLSSCP